MKCANDDTKLKGIAFHYGRRCCHHRGGSEYHVKGTGSRVPEKQKKEKSQL